MSFINPNLCKACLPEGEAPSYMVADTGVCGRCGYAGDVWDLALLSVYRAHGLTDEEVHERLPRLRVMVDFVELRWRQKPGSPSCKTCAKWRMDIAYPDSINKTRSICRKCTGHQLDGVPIDDMYTGPNCSCEHYSKRAGGSVVAHKQKWALSDALAARAPDLKKAFGVFGHFYDRKFPSGIVPCREILEIVDRREVPYDFQSLPLQQPHLVVVMMNPGSSHPRDAAYMPRVVAGAKEIVGGREMVEAIPDNAQYQIMRLMLLGGWRHARILNLSDVREGSSAAFMKVWPALDESHSIFSSGRRGELEAIVGTPERVLLAWSQDARLLPLARQAEAVMAHHPLLGLPRGEGLYAYPSPMLQAHKEAWLTEVAAML